MRKSMVAGGGANRLRLRPIGLVLLAALVAMVGLDPCGPLGVPTVLAPTAWAQSDELPPAEQVLEKAIEATGGREAIKKITNRISIGSLEIPAMGIKAKMTTYSAAPNKVYSVAESDALGKLESGTDGDVFWEVTMMTGARIKQGEEKAAAQREARFYSDLEWRDLYKSVETVGRTEVAGHECYKLKMTPPEGKPEYHYYDTESYLLRKLESTVVSEMGEVTVEIFPEEYKEVDGVMLPYRSRQVLMGMQEMLFVTDSVEHNADLPADLFDLPAEIQALQPSQSDQASPE